MATGQRAGGPRVSSGGSLASSMGQVAVGSMVANVCAYLVHLPASAWLSTSSYGEFAVLLQATLVLGVPALALQAVAAREVVTGRPIGSLLRLGGITAVAVAILAALAVVPVMTLAHTGFTATAAAMAVAPLLVLISVGQGILQGRGQFHRLAWVIGMVGVVRTVPPLIALAVGGGSADALVATMLGAVVAVGIVGWQTGVRDLGSVGARDPGGRLSPTTVLHASQVQLVLISATSVDLLLARVVLSEHDSGVYALGTVASKVAFWLPQAIGLVLFPRLADAQRSARALRTGVGVLIGLAGVTTVAALVGGPLVPVVIGDDYRPVAGLLWLFAITGGALAILQVALLAAIARERTRIAVVPWAVVVGEVVVILTVAHSVLGLAVTAASGAVLAATLTVAATMRTATVTR
ncbi:polysaccharide biosynthesis protein [Williamsia maris]|uniref:Membrane protein involved in the export of O-antigen and teichoic acid n=1 Tax=Williamsia maris TaxID=72806 RepID=A0ABT1HDQ2_9NOCA|nr:polysaccharide biosynthesis protein [Williamsia maris]MCP2176384.1 Membrane protein involved in the export of O-antigen and teichoic acid [Williamsia maris]